MELYFRTVLERVADNFFSTYPIAQLKDRGFIRGKIDEAVPGKHREHIEVVGELPICLVGRGVGGEIRRVNEEHHTGHILILLEQLTVITRSNGQPAEVVISWRVAFTLLYNVSFCKSS